MHFARFVSFPASHNPKVVAESRSHDNESEASRLHDITIPDPEDAVNQAIHSAAFLSHTLSCKKSSTRTSKFVHRMIRTSRPSPLFTARWQSVARNDLRHQNNLSGFSVSEAELNSAPLHQDCKRAARGLNPRSTNLHNGRKKQ